MQPHATSASVAGPTTTTSDGNGNAKPGPADIKSQPWKALITGEISEFFPARFNQKGQAEEVKVAVGQTFTYSSGST